MSVFSIKGLSPEVWEAYKWHLRVKNLSPFFDDIILKDDKIPNGHYDRGEAYIRKDEKDLPLTGKELKAFEDELVKEGSFQLFGEDGKALKAIVEGKCLREGYKYVDCTPREISDATESIAQQRLHRYAGMFFEIPRSIYAEPLRRASDKDPANPDIALVAGKALFDDKKYAESIPYFTRANAYANDSTAFEYLAKIAFEVSDLAFLKKSVDDGRISDEALIEFFLEKGKSAITDKKPSEILKAAYALNLFKLFHIQGEQEAFVALAKVLPNEADVLQAMLQDYPKDFKTDLLAAKKMKVNAPVQRQAKPAGAQQSNGGGGLFD